MTAIRIATFVNDEGHYAEMRRSFEAAGFVPPAARFTREAGEPYGGISRLGQAREPYVMLVHQDVRCDWGDSAASLLSRLTELTERDPTWVVAGNAGRRLGGRRTSQVESAEHEGPSDVTKAAARKLVPIRHIADPHGTTWASVLPQRVISLDENLLILRTERQPDCSPDLSGWHLYGADVVLNASVAGGSAYVIDFRVTHLSGGNPDGYEDARRRFIACWQRRCRGGMPASPGALVAVHSALSALEQLGQTAGR
jgi:hypothetical protein